MRENLNLLFQATDRVILETPFFCINPITQGTNLNTKTKAQSWRADINVVEYRNFLFEIDSINLKTQEQLISHLVTIFPIRTVTYSGGKSYHIIVSLVDSLPFIPQTTEGIQAYKDLWTGIADKLERESNKFLGTNQPLFDPSTKNCSRLSRIPGATRPENGVVQDLIYTGNLTTADFVLQFYRERKVYNSEKLDINAELGAKEFHQLIQSNSMANLRIKFARPELWVRPVNMYPEILKLTMWAIDQTGVPKSTLLSYMSTNVLPALLEAGYPMDKWDKGVHAAYEYKGL